MKKNFNEENVDGFETLYSFIKFKNLEGEVIKKRYKVIKLLGVGGMGDVYKAFDMIEKRKVALKRISPPLSIKKSLVLSQFIKEISSLELIQSPYVIKIYDAFKEEYYYYLVMELLEGENLKTLILENKNEISLLELVSIMSKISQGLASIHKVGIIHRDIKPSNIIVNRENNIVKILDFGLACRLEETDDNLCGTLNFMSPEQFLKKSQEITYASDIFSLGCTFYFMLTKQLPFKGEGLQYIIEICEKDPIPPHEINKEIPIELSKLVMNLLEKEPNKRMTGFQIHNKLEEIKIKIIENILKSDFFIEDSIESTQELSLNDLYIIEQISLLNDKNSERKIKAIRRLGALRNKKAIKPLLRLMKKENNIKIITLILKAFCKIKDSEIVEYLREIEKSSNDYKLKKLINKTIRKILSPKSNILLEIKNKILLIYDKIYIKICMYFWKNRR